jgi:hypothetical protein
MLSLLTLSKSKSMAWLDKKRLGKLYITCDQTPRILCVVCIYIYICTYLLLCFIRFTCYFRYLRVYLCMHYIYRIIFRFDTGTHSSNGMVGVGVTRGLNTKMGSWCSMEAGNS